MEGQPGLHSESLSKNKHSQEKRSQRFRKTALLQEKGKFKETGDPENCSFPGWGTARARRVQDSAETQAKESICLFSMCVGVGWDGGDSDLWENSP